MPLTKNEIKLIKSYHQKKYREQDNVFIVEGEKMVQELFNQSKFTINNIYFTQDYNENIIPDIIEKTLVSLKDLERMSHLKSSNKVLAVVNQNNQTEINFEENSLILALDCINDPGNLGTIIRTADWFGITQIITTKKTVELYNPKVIQSSMGAIYRINFITSDNLLSDLSKFKSLDYEIVGANMNGENLYKNTPKEKTVVVIGSESHGISTEIEKILDKSLTIPKFGETESLNVAIATGIILSDIKRKI
jgi:TrmH family RNA methyltransferase